MSDKRILWQDIHELETEYSDFARKDVAMSLDLGDWLPSFRQYVRPLIPGELVLVMGKTGVGKSALIQSISHACPHRILAFEMELPGTLWFERLVAMSNNIPASRVSHLYQENDIKGIMLGELEHIYTVTASMLGVQQMHETILRAQTELDPPPLVILVDYVGLLQGKGGTRHERVGNAAEQLKVIAKDTNTIVVCVSQIRRKGDDDDGEIYLHDGKHAGELENSAGLVIGCWRDNEDAELLHLRVLKNTKGRAGQGIDCNFNGSTMQITERAQPSRQEGE